MHLKCRLQKWRPFCPGEEEWTPWSWSKMTTVLQMTWHCQWVGTTLVQIMACCLFGTKPLSEPKYKTLHSWKCIWKHCLRHCGHFVQVEMSNFKPCLKQCWPSSLMYGSTGLSEYINVNFLPMRHSVKWNDKLNWNHICSFKKIFFWALWTGNSTASRQYFMFYSYESKAKL